MWMCFYWRLILHETTGAKKEEILLGIIYNYYVFLIFWYLKLINMWDDFFDSSLKIYIFV